MVPGVLKGQPEPINDQFWLSRERITPSPLHVVQLPLPRRPVPSHGLHGFSVMLHIFLSPRSAATDLTYIRMMYCQSFSKFDCTSISKSHKYTFDGEPWPEQEVQIHLVKFEMQF